MRRLDEAARSALTVVVAPAGAGKSVSLAYWAHQQPEGSVRWLDAEAGVDPTRLAREVRAAAKRGLPRQSSTSSQHLVARTAHDLADRTAHQVVVIDDAHLMSARCWTLIDELVNQCPAAIRLVLLCRWDPPISRLVPELRGHLTVLRGDALRMSEAESSALVRAHAGRQPAAVVKALVDCSQGWSAVLVLAARMIAASPDPVATVARLSETGLAVADLLANHVFASLPGRIRHLLLCVAGELTVTPAVAARLSTDPEAGQLLAELEADGFLVGREAPSASSEPDDDLRYRLHPLLVEVLRRRLVAGGVEILRARAVVLRAARVDVDRGDLGDALRRMVAIGAWDDAAWLVGEHGLDLLMCDHGPLIRRLTLLSRGAVESTRRSWVPIALERWTQGDYAGATRWIDRVVSQPSVEPEDDRTRLESALLRLMRARTGADNVRASVHNAVTALAEEGSDGTSVALRAFVLIELGAAENWLGRLLDAETHLGLAALLARRSGVSRLQAAALSHLALTEYMLGRVRTCVEVADEATSTLVSQAPGTRSTRARLLLAQKLAAMHLLPWPGTPLRTAPPMLDCPSVNDLTTLVWHHIHRSRLMLVAGSVPEAKARLTVPLQLPDLPSHLAAALLMERCVHALLVGSADELAVLSGQLSQAGAEAESMLAAAMCADLRSDVAAASLLLEPVVAREVPLLLPTTSITAAIYLAQLVDALGDTERAIDLLTDAVRATAAQRDAAPFLGWSRNGSPMPRLLAELAKRDGSVWVTELHQAAVNHPGLIRFYEDAGATLLTDAQDLMARGSVTHIPALTRREIEVLGELARGSSYADIGEALFVSQNTVKTHVSSLYSKLGARRRSDALRIAREHRLV